MNDTSALSVAENMSDLELDGQARRDAQSSCENTSKLVQELETLLSEPEAYIR